MNACENALNPNPVDLIVNDVVLNEPKDITGVETGLYRAFRLTRASAVLAGDLTADNLVHRGTFAQYREIAVKQITTGNATVSELWSTIYGTIYIANFMIERIPEIDGVTTAVRTRSMATAYFIRGIANFTAVSTFGGVPKVITTDIETNKNIGRTSKEDMLAFIEEDFMRALGNLGAKQSTPATVCDNTVRAALARFYLYKGDYAQAEKYASDVIESGDYTLEKDYATTVNKDFTTESIFEVGYTIADDGDGTSLNDLFVSRREMIPSNEVIQALASTESGDRFSSINFKVENLKGSDNGWEVAKYGTAVADNNNIVVLRLGEIYLIRAEARTMLGNVTGAESAQSDVNTLRKRANAPSVGAVSQSQMIQIIENERRYELSFEGHRWYDLVRTNRAKDVMPQFNSNWRSAYELWPIPQREIQNNPGLAGEQNPGY
jgi:hypothetical protein